MSNLHARSDRYTKTQSTDQRTPFQRDRDRILYSPEFRRLSGVTQVARADESYQYHDRLSHSLKVSQIGRRLTEYFLNENSDDFGDLSDHLNADVVEAAALAHDLGHPPFGHVVEQELDSLIRDRGIDDGFEGNPQSFRIVTRTSAFNNKYEGLNLTRATLNAILKYPWERGNAGKFDKWGYYESESDYFDFARKLSDTPGQSLEAQIMDWADDLAYAIHDVVDFYQSGLIPFDQLLEGTNERDEFIRGLFDGSDLSAADIDVETFLDDLAYEAEDELKTPFKGTDADRSSLNHFSSYLIRKYLGIYKDWVTISKTANGYTLDIDEKLENQVEVLKYMTVFYVIDDSSLMSQQHGQREMIRTIFNVMMENAGSSSRFTNIVPSPFRERLDKIDSGADDRYRVRTVTDFIASMTERQATQFYQRLTGHSAGSLHDRIIR